MFDTHVDALYVWVAVGAMSVAVFAVVTQLPTAAPPDGAAAAETIDEVVTGPPGSVATRELDAEEWSLSGRRLGLRSDAGTVHETLLRRVVPVVNESLVSVLDDGSPSATFDSPSDFENATVAATTNNTRWRPAPDRLTVRHVAWGGVDVTLVG
jgi:hypothetical protein